MKEHMQIKSTLMLMFAQFDAAQVHLLSHLNDLPPHFFGYAFQMIGIMHFIYSILKF